MVNSPYKVTIIVIYYLIRIRTFTCFRSMSFRCHRLNFIIFKLGNQDRDWGRALFRSQVSNPILKIGRESGERGHRRKMTQGYRLSVTRGVLCTPTNRITTAV